MAESDTTPWSDDIYQKLNPWVFLVGHGQMEPGWVSQPQNDLKTYFDLWYITNGDGEVKIDGRWFSFSQGDLVIIKPGETYQQERGPFGSFYFFVHPFGQRKKKLESGLTRNWPKILPLQYYPIIKDYFAELFETYTTKPQGYPLVLKAVSLHVFRTILPLLQTHKSVPFPPAFPRVLAAQSYIETEYAKPITLENVAEVSNLSSSYLSVLFHRYLHVSPIDYLIEVRLRAAKLLLARGMSVSQTARTTGFQSLHYFSRTFKKRVGVSPTQFVLSRHSHRAKQFSP